MIWLLLGALALALLLTAGSRLTAVDPRVLAQGVRVVAVAAASLALLRSGRFAFFLVPLLQRWLHGQLRAGGNPFWTPPPRTARTAAGAGQGQATTVATKTLRMRLDHESGTVDGEVLAGAHRGRRLADLSVAEVVALLEASRTGDAEAVPLLEAYLDRREPAWREAAEPPKSEPRRASAGMTRDEAWQILGLQAGASPEEIRAAHHRLMKRLHPDQGGTNFLATQVNQAKDLLLGD